MALVSRSRPAGVVGFLRRLPAHTFSATILFDFGGGGEGSVDKVAEFYVKLRS